MCHMCNDRTLSTDLVPLKQPQNVTLGDEHHLQAVGRGTVVLDIELSHGENQEVQAS